MYPYCGKLFGYEWHDATSRIVNSVESEKQYPWVVLVERFHMMVDSSEDTDSEESYDSDEDGNTEEYGEEQFCSGTVIGEKLVVEIIRLIRYDNYKTNMNFLILCYI